MVIMAELVILIDVEHGCSVNRINAGGFGGCWQGVHRDANRGRLKGRILKTPVEAGHALLCVECLCDRKHAANAGRQAG